MEDLTADLPDGDLTALVGSRLCHDLINPLGAIGNGVELLAMSGQSASPEMALIEEAVRDAQARIRFFRVAFGAAGAESRVSRRELLALLDGLYGNGGRLRVAWDPAGDLPRREAKLALLMLACAEHALPLGGEVEISEGEGGVTLGATAARVKADPDLWGLFEGRPPLRRVAPAEVQFPLLVQEAASAGRDVVIEISDGQIGMHV
ncbi:histidine phosphotransferase [Rhodobacterales bacterium HKCCE2091]|nr:histidine phosphotransferase [Rhodobacterales bacterium HKCCE2091]